MNVMKLSNISIKVATINDASDWAHMLLKLDEETCYTMFEPKERSTELTKYEDKIINAIKYPRSIVFFAIDNALPMNNIVGYACAESHKNNRKSHVITAGMGILQAYCSKGIGSQLLAKLLEYAEITGIKRVEGSVAHNNHRSINMLKKFGFVLEGVKKKSIYINQAYQDEYLMALIINSENVS